MSCVLYISNHCAGCVELVQLLGHHSLVCNVVNIDDSDALVPVELVVVPALLLNGEICAYGADDILLHLRLASRS